ncbi:MAG: AAA family ATPase, partial [Gaiellaceae bacterium]|nr:AAA family ATPase [Gaiellaceae bacterium]
MTHAESSERIERTMQSTSVRSRQGGTLDLRRGAPELVGRELELELIDGVLDDARIGRARRLLVVGEPGVGKSALLDEAVRRAAALMVLRAVASEAEADLGYATLLALLRPLAPRIYLLPEGQRSALRTALELGSAPGYSRFALGAGVLNLLAGVAAEAPTLVVLDDVQWIDTASLDALSFACARLDADAVAVLAAGRPGSGERLVGARFEEHVLEPLDDAASRALLDRVAELAPHVRERVLAAAHGNPLALAELSARLTEDQRAGREPLPDELSAGDTLRRAYAGGVGRLPASSRAALLVAALASPGDPATLSAALSSCELAVDALVPAEEAGLVTLSAGRVAFRHPLVRSAIVAAASADEIRRGHATLAESLPPGEARARHLAAAAAGADERVASELERVATATAPASAASLLARAAELSPRRDDVDRRRFAAAEAAWLAGQADLARSLCERVIEGTSSAPVRAHALHLRGQIAHQTEPASRARAFLLEAVSCADRLERADVARMLGDAVASSMYAGDPRGALSLAERLAAIATHDGGVEEFWMSLHLGTALCLNGRRAEGEPHVRRAIELVETADVLRHDPRHLGSAAMAPAWVDEFERGRALAERAIGHARALGALSSLPTSLKFLAWTDYDLGRWDAALAAAFEAVEIAREIGQISQLCANLGVVAAVLAGRGDEPGCVAAAGEALALAEELELEWHRAGLLGSLGVLALGLGRNGVAVERLEQAVAILEHSGIVEASEAPFSDLVEALVRAGRRDDAQLRLLAFEEVAASSESALVEGTAARLRGLLASDGDAEKELRVATELLADGPPFALARAHLCYGERLRRMGERRRARAELEAALAIFERLGARSWAERCRQELVASGRRLRRLDPATRDELTPQELQVALQVARGLTNR